MRHGGQATQAGMPGRQRLGRALSLTLVLLALAPAARGQGAAPPLVLRGVPMAEALQRLVDATGISLVYTSELVAGKVAYCAAPASEPEALLACVLRSSGLDFVRSSSGAYVVVAAVEAPPPRGALAGRVVDAATGEALPYAHVLLADASAGTTADEAGRFAFAGLLSGRHRVSVRYLGYEPAEDEVTVPAGGQERVVVSLRPRMHALRPLVVDGLRQRPASDTLGAGRVSGGGLTALRPTRTADVARAAADLPGVAALQPLADLQIQGGGGGEYLTLLDGAPVRNPVSLGRHLAAFSPLALERLTVHRAGFGTAWSHLVGVVAVEHDVAGAGPLNAAASADAVGFNARVQGRAPLPGGREAAGMVAVRTSAWDVYRDPGLRDLLTSWDAPDPLLLTRWSGYPVAPDTTGLTWAAPDAAFSDVHAALRLRLSPFHTVHASGYHALDRLAGEFATFVPLSSYGPDHLLLTRDDYDWRNWAGQARLDGLLGARAAYGVQATGGHHASRYGYGGGTEPLAGPASLEALEAAASALRPALEAGAGTDWHHAIRELALKGTLLYSLSPRSHLEGGLAVEHAAARIERAGRFAVPLAHASAAWDLAAHATGRLALGAATAEPGVRLTYFPALQTVYAEPRLALRYDGAAGPIGPYAVRLAAGLYRQFTNEYLLSSSGATAVVPYVLFWLPPDGSLAPPRAYHAAAEAALWPAEGWTVEASAYFKAQPRLLALDYIALVADPSIEPGETPGATPDTLRAQNAFLGAVRGRAAGGTARVRWQGARLSAGAAYTLSHAVRQVPSRFEGRMVPVPGNAPHAVALDAAVRLGGGLRAGASWRGAWGRRWALRRAYYDYLALLEGSEAFTPYDLERPEDHALPATHTLDLDLTLTRTLAGAVVEARALVVNVADRRDAYDWSLAPAISLADGETSGAPAEGPAVLPRTLPGRHFAFSLRVGI